MTDSDALGEAAVTEETAQPAPAAFATIPSGADPAAMEGSSPPSGNDPAAIRVYSTGIPALDLVLGGGIPAASTVILAGRPGTGKTILAEQFLFTNATAETPALYLTTLSEPLEKVVRYLQQFTFFDRERLLRAIHYRDIGQIIRGRGIASLPQFVEDLVLERGVFFVVVDSFKALHDLSESAVIFRTALFDFARVLASSGVTALLVGEYVSEEIGRLPEFAVADGVLELTNRAHGGRDERTIRVHKLRGAAPLPGEHSFRIDASGLVVFPRLIGDIGARVMFADEPVPAGIEALDEMLGGGVRRGTSTVIAGPPGVGKTTLALQFLVEGARRGEPALLVSFQEAARHTRQRLHHLGIDGDRLVEAGLLTTLYAPPLELDLAELVGRVRSVVEAKRVRRLVIDALGDMQDAALEVERFRAACWTLMHYLGNAGVTSFFLSETPWNNLESVPLLSTVTRGDISYMSDNIILMRYLWPPHGEADRALQVLKTRSTGHDPSLRPFHIGPTGLVVAPASAAVWPVPPRPPAAPAGRARPASWRSRLPG